MKKLTPVILAVALALSVLGVLGTRIYQAAAYGGAAPEILFDSEVISVPTGADDAADGPLDALEGKLCGVVEVRIGDEVVCFITDNIGIGIQPLLDPFRFPLLPVFDFLISSL